MTAASQLWDGQSLLIGQIKGVPIGLHFTLLILGVFQWIAFMIDQGPIYFIVGILFIFTYWLILLLHEFAHVWMAWRLGGESERIILWPFGGLSFCRHSGDTQDRVKILLAGPLSHVVFGLLALILYGIFSGSEALAYYFGWCCHIHLQLFLLNMFVPAHPLDGSSCLALMLLQGYSADSTAKIYIALSVPYIIFLAWWGFTAWNFGAILLLFWLLAQSLDLIIRLRQGPAGLARHPLMSIGEQMKPRKGGNNGTNEPRASAASSIAGNGSNPAGINIDTWTMDPPPTGGTMMGPGAGVGLPPSQNWGSGVIGGGSSSVTAAAPPSSMGVAASNLTSAEISSDSVSYPAKEVADPSEIVITEKISGVPGLQVYDLSRDDSGSEQIK